MFTTRVAGSNKVISMTKLERSMSMQNRGCPLCEEKLAQWRLTLHDQDLALEDSHLLQCKKCHMTFLDRPCDAAFESRFYANHIARRHHHRPSLAAFEAEYQRQLPTLEQTAKIIPIPQDTAPRVLDVGCGNGFLLRRLKEKGCQVEGIDLDDDLVEFGRKVLGYQVTRQNIEDFQPASRYDAIVMTDVLEHLAAPGPVLRKLRELLVPAGLLVVKVPNWQVGRFHVLLAREPERYQPNLHIQVEHLNYFSASTLRKMLDMAGFGSVDIRPEAATYPGTCGDTANGQKKCGKFLIQRLRDMVSQVMPAQLICTPCLLGVAKNTG